MRPLLPLRNFLVVVGAYYVSAWVVMPLWAPIAWMDHGRVYQAGSSLLLLSQAIRTIPILMSAILAGAAAGYFLVASRRASWLAVLGIFVAVCVWSSTRWYVRPSFEDLLWQGTKATVAGSLAVLAALAVWNRRARLDAEESL